jgi:hypothetical protein
MFCSTNHAPSIAMVSAVSWGTITSNLLLRSRWIRCNALGLTWYNLARFTTHMAGRIHHDIGDT